MIAGGKTNGRQTRSSCAILPVKLAAASFEAHQTSRQWRRTPKVLVNVGRKPARDSTRLRGKHGHLRSSERRTSQNGISCCRDSRELSVWLFQSSRKVIGSKARNNPKSAPGSSLLPDHYTAALRAFIKRVASSILSRTNYLAALHRSKQHTRGRLRRVDSQGEKPAGHANLLRAKVGVRDISDIWRRENFSPESSFVAIIGTVSNRLPHQRKGLQKVLLRPHVEESAPVGKRAEHRGSMDMGPGRPLSSSRRHPEVGVAVLGYFLPAPRQKTGFGAVAAQY